jgi:hypothetical protein
LRRTEAVERLKASIPNIDDRHHAEKVDLLLRIRLRWLIGESEAHGIRCGDAWTTIKQRR